MTIEIVDSLGNIINAQCDTNQKNTNSIKCKIDEQVDNDYTIEDLIYYSSDEIIIFSGNGNIFKLICIKQKKVEALSLSFIIIILYV